MSLGNYLGESFVRCLLRSLGHSPRISPALCPARNSAVCSADCSPLSPEVCVRNCRPDCSRGCVRFCILTCLPVYSQTSGLRPPIQTAECRMQRSKWRGLWRAPDRSQMPEARAQNAEVRGSSRRNVSALGCAAQSDNPLGELERPLSDVPWLARLGLALFTIHYSLFTISRDRVPT
jgi:hypothetical protein